MSIPETASVHSGIRAAGNDVWENFNKNTASNSPLALPGAVPALTADSVAAAVKAVQALPPAALPAFKYNGVMNAYYAYGLNPTEENAQTVINLAEQSLDKVISEDKEGVNTEEPDIDSDDAVGDNERQSNHGTGELNRDYEASIDKTLENEKIKNKEEKTAKEVNDWWNAKGYENPYQIDSPVYEIELAETERFARVFSDDSNMAGGWIMKAEDIEGLTAEQIKDKYALPILPKYVCDVVLEVGSIIRCGIAGPQKKYSGNGGGVQFDLMLQYIGTFSNKRLLQ